MRISTFIPLIAVPALLGGCQGRKFIESFDQSDDGDILVYSESNGHRIIAEEKGRGIRLVGYGSEPTLSIDNVIVVNGVAGRKGRFVMYRPGASGRVLGFSSIYDSQPAFSTDGRSVNFVRSRGRRSYSMGGDVPTDFVLMRSTLTGKVRQLTAACFFSMVLSPGCDDGRHVYFTGMKSAADTPSIYRVRVVGAATLERIATLETPEVVAASPRENLIAYTDRREGRYFVKISRKDGSRVRVISREAADQLKFFDRGSRLAILLSDKAAKVRIRRVAVK